MSKSKPERPIITHTLDQVKIALAAASELNMPVTLQSASGAIFYAGSLYLLRMFEQAKQDYPMVEARFILDCADAGAEAIAAMQMGHKHIRSFAPPPLRQKLADIAAQYHVEMMDSPYESLDLHHVRDTKSACKQWLRERMT